MATTVNENINRNENDDSSTNNGDNSSGDNSNTKNNKKAADNNNRKQLQGLDLLIYYHKLGLKPVPLSWNHKPVVDWTPIYDKPEYWSDEKSIAECPKFSNIATAYGKTHVKDSDDRDLYLNGLDCDSESVHKIFTTQIDEISDPLLKSKLLDLYPKYGAHPATAKVSLLDFLKEITFVVKTRKPCGFLVLWLSHTQHAPIGTKDCKSGHEFEIKTDKSLGLSTLPPSTHRDDQTFRYLHVGRADKIGAIDELYDIFIGLLKECLVSDPAKVNGNVNDNSNDDNRSRDKKQATTTTTTTSLYDLSEQMIQTTVAYFTPYYVVGHRKANATLRAWSGT